VASCGDQRGGLPVPGVHTPTAGAAVVGGVGDVLALAWFTVPAILDSGPDVAFNGLILAYCGLAAG
jgi:hypothetical protein